MENKVNIYNQMLSGVVRSIDELASESQNYLLEKEKFGQCAQYFIQIVSQAIQIINTPAIRLVDTNGEDHYIVAGEKWKVFAAIIADIPGTALRPIVATNPFTMKVDRYETTKENAMEALINYEETCFIYHFACKCFDVVMCFHSDTYFRSVISCRDYFPISDFCGGCGK